MNSAQKYTPLHTLGTRVRVINLNSSLRHLCFNIKLLEKESPTPYMEITGFIVSLILDASLPSSRNSYLLVRKMSMIPHWQALLLIPKWFGSFSPIFRV